MKPNMKLPQVETVPCCTKRMKIQPKKFEKDTPRVCWLIKNYEHGFIYIKLGRWFWASGFQMKEQIPHE